MRHARVLLIVVSAVSWTEADALNFGLHPNASAADQLMVVGNLPTSTADTANLAIFRPLGPYSTEPLTERTVSRLHLRTGPGKTGLWTVRVRTAPVVVPSAAMTVTLTPNAWNQITFAAPIIYPADGGVMSGVVELTPAEPDMELSFYIGAGSADVVWAHSTSYGAPQAAPRNRIRPTAPYFYRDGGSVPGNGHMAAVIEISDSVDPFAPPQCAAHQRTEVSGNPYIVREVVFIDAGTTISQSFQAVWRAEEPDAGVDNFYFGVSFPPDIRTELLSDGQLVAAGSNPQYVLRGSNGRRCLPLGTYAGPSHELRIQAGDAGARVLRYSAGPGLDACSPIARSTWGGSTSNASGDPGADYPFQADVYYTRPSYADLDQDGFGDPANVAVDCAPRPGHVWTPDDCDDSRASVRPGASELCNGRDDDCDGVVDAEDSKLVVPKCALQAGVCRGALTSASRCKGDAGWQACDGLEYGSEYQPLEVSSCDNTDNDCDGEIERVVPCPRQLGPCAGAMIDACRLVTDCTAAEYGPTFEAAEVTCDGIDNDCDGEIDGADVDFMQLCPKQLGVCKESTRPAIACTNEPGAACASESYGADYEADETRCDGLDNDCDGAIDEMGCAPPFEGSKRTCAASGGAPFGVLALFWILRRSRAATSALLVSLLSACSAPPEPEPVREAPPTCSPVDCTRLGKQCGTWDDGCGGVLSCDTCDRTATTCSATGQCVCAPKTCLESGRVCGSIDDGCGGTLECGRCAPGSACGSDGGCAPLSECPLDSDWCRETGFLCSGVMNALIAPDSFGRMLAGGASGIICYRDVTAISWPLTLIYSTQPLARVRGAARSPSEILYPAGSELVVLRDGEWRVEQLPGRVTGGHLVAVSVNAAGVAWTVGNPQWIVRRSGEWNQLAAPANRDWTTPLDVWTTRSGNAWIATAEGRLLFATPDSIVSHAVNGAPDTTSWNAVTGFGDDVWAVGSGGEVARWDGAAWNVVFRNASGEPLNAVAGRSSTDLWVGGRTLLHWDGAAFTDVPLPGAVQYGADAGVVNAGDAVRSLVAVDARTIWAVGAGDLLWKWDGTSWHQALDRTFLSVFSLPGTDAVLAIRSTDNTLERIDATSSWRTSGTALIQNGALHDVDGDGSQELWVGDHSFIAASSGGGSFGRLPHSLRSVAMTPSGGWAVGASGTTLTLRSPAGWIQVPSGTNAHLFGVAARDGDVWAVGESGTALTVTADGGWSSSSTGTGATLRSVAIGSTTTYAVGDDGVILKRPRSGGGWQIEQAGQGPALLDVAFGPNDMAMAVGMNGIALKLTPTGWKPTTNAYGSALRAVRVVSDQDAWAAGDDGVYRYRPALLRE